MRRPDNAAIPANASAEGSIAVADRGTDGQKHAVGLPAIEQDATGAAPTGMHRPATTRTRAEERARAGGLPPVRAPLLKSGSPIPSRIRRAELDVPAPQGEAAFRVFFEQHHAELARFAWLLLGEKAAAEDLAADAMLAVWKQWNRVERSASGIAYARGIVANLAKTRIRSAVRERRRNAMFWLRPGESVSEPNVAAVVDVRRALARLPFRKRACVVLRHSLGLSELETAEALGVSVGTVKSQTSKGLAELRKILGPPSGGQNGSSWDSIPNGVGR